MRKILLAAALSFVSAVAFCQTTPYLNKSWAVADSVADDVSARLGNGYTAAEKVVIEDSGRNIYDLKSKEVNRTVEVELFRGKANTPIIRQVNITGSFDELFAVYSKMFNVNMSADDVKAKGVTFIPAQKIGGKSYMANLSKAGSNSTDYWLLQLKID